MKKALIIISLLTIALIPTGVHADPDPGASLSAGQGYGHPGAVGVVVPITLISDPGAEVAAINFDLSFDSSQLTFQQVSEGYAALAADKIAQHPCPRPSLRWWRPPAPYSVLPAAKQVVLQFQRRRESHSKETVPPHRLAAHAIGETASESPRRYDR